MARSKTAVIIGAGPAGLTAAYELLRRTEYRPIVLERSRMVGGISKTIKYRGNRIDIGGHRFFSKSRRVTSWWLDILPLEADPDNAAAQHFVRSWLDEESLANAVPPGHEESVMLLRRRRSRVLFNGRMFAYPLQLTPETFLRLGLTRSARIAASYLWSAAFSRGTPSNLEEFFINRFGRELYKTFFESYTEKVWGVPCSSISADWGAQRIKGLSLAKALRHFIERLLPTRAFNSGGQETSLIEYFLYPKLGPGQLWEEVARRIEQLGGEIHLGKNVTGLQRREGRVVSVSVRDQALGEENEVSGDVFFSTMPVDELVEGMSGPIPSDVADVAKGLPFRSFMTVGVLARRLNAMRDIVSQGANNVPEDNWIYVLEPHVRVGRLQFFNNWSPAMVANPDNAWVGLEYFCDEGDELWSLSDGDFAGYAIKEASELGLLDPEEVLDHCVLRERKAYPAYFGSYDRFDVIQAFLDGVANLYPIGRNGIHRYNNQDHSMLTAMVAVDNICLGRTDRSNIWTINSEQDFAEE